MATAGPGKWHKSAGRFLAPDPVRSCASPNGVAGDPNLHSERWPGRLARRQAATSGAVVFVTWGAPLKVHTGGVTAWFRAFVAGVHDQPARVAHGGSQDGIGVHLSAPGAFTLLGVPGADLANRCLDLEDVLGHRRAEALVERLWGAQRPSGRIALVEATLADRLASSPNAIASFQDQWPPTHLPSSR